MLIPFAVSSTEWTRSAGYSTGWYKPETALTDRTFALPKFVYRNESRWP